MKIYDFFIRQVKIKSWKDAAILVLKLLLIAIIADELYNAFHILPCYYNAKYTNDGISYFLISRSLFFLFIYLIYHLVRSWKRQGTLKDKSLKLGLIIAIIWIINGSLFFIYYIDGPYWGKVVDADTGEPIAGANVMAKWNFDYYLFITSSTSYADARETITDDKGRFFIAPARQIWFYPLSDLYLRNIGVYKRGYDSHPPQMYSTWSDAEKEKWKEKLIRINPNYNHDSEIIANYYRTFYLLPDYIGAYKPTIIRLNKALTKKEQRRARASSASNVTTCEQFKIKKYYNELERRGPK